MGRVVTTKSTEKMWSARVIIIIKNESNEESYCDYAE